MARGDLYTGDVRKVITPGKKYRILMPDGKGINVTVTLLETNNDGDGFVEVEFSDGKTERYLTQHLILTEVFDDMYSIKLLSSVPQDANLTHLDNLLSESDKQILKEFALEKDDQKLKYSVDDIYNLVKEDIKVSYSIIEKLINDFRKEYLIDNLFTSLSDIDKEAKDFVRKDSFTAVEKSLDLLKQNFQSYKQVETDEIRRVFDLPADKIIHYPIELFKLILSHYENTLSNEILGFSGKELNFERKLKNIVNTHDKSITKIFIQNSVLSKIELIKEILMQIQVKRNLIKKKYKHVVERFNQFSIFKQRQMDNLGIFTTEEDSIKYERDIPIVILLFIEYYYYLNGKYIDFKLYNNILAYYSIVGFCFPTNKVNKYNGLKLLLGSDNLYSLIDKYIERKVIDSEDQLNITMTLPYIMIKQQYMEEILTKTEGIYVKGLDSFINSDPIIQVEPKIIKFNVTPTSLTSTSQIEISWAVENSSSVCISGLGEVSFNGKKVIKFSDIFDNETKSIAIVSKRDNKTTKQSVDITIIPEPIQQIVTIDNLSYNNLLEQLPTTKFNKPTLEEYMSRDKPILKTSPNSTYILYITLTVFTMSILLFLWYARNQNEYSAAPSESSVIEKIETTLNTSQTDDISYTQGVVNSDGVNIRSVPSLDSYISGMVYRGEEYSILEKSEEAMTIDGLGTYHWFLIENNSNKGWIFGKFLDLE